ncbi:hypothetical protein FA15DRAFT_655533 [Coprinopsis marcescibilis]|uniref:Uncharacterized protein n=1 Tax=Coprinopsis marcescibilis TaxID=230819 RepID=A0A5C3KWZ3_COPMA|nr:hypothetical protein FA15DRAFT_655533 [Coprinopsis marcescibilis]
MTWTESSFSSTTRDTGPQSADTLIKWKPETGIPVDQGYPDLTPTDPYNEVGVRRACLNLERKKCPDVDGCYASPLPQNIRVAYIPVCVDICRHPGKACSRKHTNTSQHMPSAHMLGFSLLGLVKPVNSSGFLGGLRGLEPSQLFYGSFAPDKQTS